MIHALCVTYNGRSTVYYFSVKSIIYYTTLKNLDMKYEISEFDHVFENKNLMQLRKKMPRFLLREANSESCIVGMA